MEREYLQKLPVNDSKWVKNTSQFNKDFIEIWNEDNDERYFLEVDVQYPEKLHDFRQWFTVSTWKNEDWKNLKTGSQFPR